MRLIDADKFEVLSWNVIPKGYSDSFADGVMWLAEKLDKCPTIEPKRGKWIPIHGEPIVACSVCRKKYDWDTEAQYYNFCPNCGAKMEDSE